MHTILWVGAAEGLGASPVARSALVDIAWAPDLDQALTLSLADFHAVVMDAPEPVAAEPAAAKLRAAGAREVMVTCDPARYPAPRDLAQLVPQPRWDPAEEEAPTPPGVIGSSRRMRETFALVARACACAATVLLQGETGTGKEVLARAVHAGSGRSTADFVALNCAAFPDTLLESELFGHTRGAFTGAHATKTGLFEAADAGTLFLDEIGETSGPLQAKLLRVLQEREVRPVGGNRSRNVDVRVIAASNRDLRREVSRGHFREDLYYRLAVFPIYVPPLRDRREDVLPLARHFLALHGAREEKPDCRFSKQAERWLLAHRWPGNVRELENEVQRALALSDAGTEIPAERLSPRVSEWCEPIERLVHEGEPLRESLDRVEAWLLRRSLDQHGGRKAITARALGLTREGLYKKLKRLGIA